MKIRLTLKLAENVLTSRSSRASILRVGSAPDNQLRIKDRAVEASHLELRQDGGLLYVVALGPRAITHMNGRLLAPDQPYVVDGDAAFELGSHVLHVAVTAEKPLPPPPPPPTERLDVGPSGPSTYLRYLPTAYQGHEFTSRLLLIFESIWEPLERRQDQIHRYLDPLAAPRSFLPWLERNLALPLPEHLPEARRRLILAQAGSLHRQHGTLSGLRRLLELACGVPIDVREDNEHASVLHVRVPEGVDGEVVSFIAHTYRPAHVALVINEEDP